MQFHWDCCHQFLHPASGYDLIVSLCTCPAEVSFYNGLAEHVNRSTSEHSSKQDKLGGGGEGHHARLAILYLNLSSQL